MQISNRVIVGSFGLLFLSACDAQTETRAIQAESPPVTIDQTGSLESARIDEASGLQASFSHAGDFFTHNDEGEPIIYVVNESGADLGHISIVPAKNKDWEDITSVPMDGGHWVVAGDIGDNSSKRKSINLYFIEEPQTGDDGRYVGQQALKHRLTLTYPDGPRDCEAMAYDPVGKQILLLSKRDKPPRLYTVDLETALAQDKAELDFLGSIRDFRPPTMRDHFRWGDRSDYISSATGLDISADGSEAVVITYRSLYRFQRKEGEDWLSALQRKPEEVVGPPAVQNEAIAYSVDGKTIYVTTEKRPAPMYRIEFTD